MRIRSAVLVSVLSFAFLAIGCGGGTESGSEAQSTAPAAPPPAAAAPAGTAKISGTVNFKGTPPQARRLRLDAECQGLQAGEVVQAETVVINANNTLKHVFVYVKEGLGDQTFAPSPEPVIFDQSGCMYTPHVFGIQVGQTMKILNSDPLLHNIHALPEENRPFNFGMPKQGDERDRTFMIPEVMVKIKCDVHPWMGAWAGVVPHPFHSTTGDAGTFSLENLPAGEYVIEAWQEEYGFKTQTITVGDGEAVTLDFDFGDASS